MRTELDLSLFVEKGEDTREYLATPWTAGEWTYATNGKIAVRVPARDDAPVDTEGVRQHLAMGKLFASAYPVVTWWPMPPVDAWKRTQQTCAYCAGRGVESQYCPDCNGIGDVECACCGQEMTCNKCEGSGRADSDQPCGHCKGTKVMDRYANMVTPSGVLGWQTLDIMAQVEGVEIGVGEDWPEWGKIRWRSGDHEGIVMGLTGDYRADIAKQIKASKRMHAAIAKGETHD